jgi:hypothetical protein
MNLQGDLAAAIVDQYGQRLAAPPRLNLDAITVALDNGVEIELRFASAEEYVLHWRWGEAELRIDTAPIHPDIATFPNHLHDAEGIVRPDPLTVPGRLPWDNVRAVLDAVLVQPLLS